MYQALRVTSSPRSRRATRQQGARRLDSRLCGYRGRGTVQDRFREEAAQERVAGAGCVIRRERLDWKDIFATALRKRDALTTARLNEDLRSLLRSGRSASFGDEFGLGAAERNEIRPRGDGRCKVLGNRACIDLDRPNDLGVRSDRRESAAGRLGGSDRQTDPIGGR